MNFKKWIWNQSVNQFSVGKPEQAGCGEQPNSCVLHMFARKFLCNVNDTRTIIGLCLLVTPRLGQSWDPG